MSLTTKSTESPSSNSPKIIQKNRSKNNSINAPKINKDTSPDILYTTFLELERREQKLKEHLAVALKAQKSSVELYENEKSARTKIEKIYYELAEKCDKVKSSNQDDRKNMLENFQTQSDKITEQITVVTDENNKLTIENTNARERILALLEQKEKFIKDACSWRDISQETRKEMNKLREENNKVRTICNELTKAAIDDKKLITNSIKSETELRNMLTLRAAEFTDMYKKSVQQSNYITSVANDMKKMKKDLEKFRTNLRTAETDKLKVEKIVLGLQKDKLIVDAANLKKDIKIRTLEKLCRALQAKAKENLEAVVEEPKIIEKESGIEKNKVIKVNETEKTEIVRKEKTEIVQEEKTELVQEEITELVQEEKNPELTPIESPKETKKLENPTKTEESSSNSTNANTNNQLISETNIKAAETEKKHSKETSILEELNPSPKIS